MDISKITDRVEYTGAKGSRIKSELHYYVELELYATDHLSAPLRTKVVKGKCAYPVVGEPLIIVGEALNDSLDNDAATFRQITTSPIREIWTKAGITYVKTENSVYRLVLREI